MCLLQAPIDNAGALNTWSSHALIPEADVAAAIKACNLSEIGPLLRGERNVASIAAFTGYGASCNTLISNIQTVAFDDVDIYDLV